jgi:hypothetical protein
MDLFERKIKTLLEDAEIKTAAEGILKETIVLVKLAKYVTSL